MSTQRRVWLGFGRCLEELDLACIGLHLQVAALPRAQNVLQVRYRSYAGTAISPMTDDMVQSLRLNQSFIIQIYTSAMDGRAAPRFDVCIPGTVMWSNSAY